LTYQIFRELFLYVCHHIVRQAISSTDMENQKVNQSEKKSEPTLESIAEAWVRLCLFHIQHKKQLTNQYQNNKYEYQTT